jgi:hypothetical protein
VDETDRRQMLCAVRGRERVIDGVKDIVREEGD